jgi:replicative DNA helicase
VIDHALVVLAGILPARKDHLLYAMTHLEEDHFRNEIQRGIFTALDRYYDIASDVLPKKILSDLLANSKSLETSKALLYEEVYSAAEALTVPDHEFRYSVDALKDQRAEQLTGEAITTAFEILARGTEVGKDTLEGHKDARAYAYSEFARIDHLDNIEVAPEGDMRHEGSDVISEYMDRKEGKTGQGILTGIPSLDKTVQGFGNGELVVVAAFTGAGKTQLCCQTAWHTAIMQGKNVFFATSETVRSTVRRRIVSRHSRLPQFGLPKGLDSNDIKNGRLSPAEEVALKAVVDDLKNNPNYGRLHITQSPRGATLSYLEARMNRQGSMWQVDLCVVDYLALLKSDRKRTSEREELNEIIKDAKVYATSFDSGRGVPMFTPWQIRRESYAEAQRTGAYGMASLSDTAEIEKSADAIMSLLRTPETPHRVSLQFLKMRDGEAPNPTPLETDFRNAYLGDPAKTTTSFGGQLGTFAPASLGL